MTTPSKSGTSISGAGSASQRDLSEFVSYLLDGSGVENVVDLHRLRRELEDESSSYGGTLSSAHSRIYSQSHRNMNIGNMSRSVSPLSTATASLQPNNNANYNHGKSLDSINLNAKSITLTSTPNDKKDYKNSPLEPAISPIRDMSEVASFPKASSKGDRLDFIAPLKSAGAANDLQPKMSAASAGPNAYLAPSMRQNIQSASSQPPKTDKEAPKYRSQPSIATTHPQPHFSASSAYLSKPAFQGESQTSDSATTRFLNHTASATTQNDSRSHTFSKSDYESSRSNRITDRRIPAVQATPTRDETTTESRYKKEELDAANDVFKGRETGANDQRVLSRAHLGDGRKWVEEGQVVGEDIDMDESLLKIYKEYGGPDSLLGTRAGSAGAPFGSNATDGEPGATHKGGRGKSDTEWIENARAMASETRVQEWISGHPGVEATDEIRELEQISSRLDRMGLPSLHPSLKGMSSSSGGPEGAGIQRFHLAKILNALLDDISRRADDVQHLSDRVLENLEARKILEDRVAELELGRNDGENRDWKIIQEQQQSLDALTAQMSTLRSELVESRHDLEDTRSLNRSLKKRISEREMERQRAEEDLEQLKSKTEKTRRLSEQTFAQMAEKVSRFRTDPTKSGMDRLTLEVIEVYEAKLANLNEKITELRSRAPGSNPTAESQSAMNDTTGPYFPKAIDLDREIEALENYGLPKRHFTRQNADGETEQILVDPSKKHQLQKLQEEQIRDLEQRLSKAQRDLLQATQQSEILKLQLLETKRPGWVEQARSDITSGLSTRELIRRDKKSWKMKLYQIDAMNLEECRTLLKNVCIHLAIPDVPSLLPGLAAIDSTLRLLPQLQSFVSAIANLVNTHYTRLFEIDASSQQSTAKLQPFEQRVAKLDEMIRVIELWARGSDDVESLRDFRREIHRMLCVREGSGSLAGCREVVNRLKERREGGISGDKSASDYKELDVLRRFKWEIFDIIGLDEGVSGLQEALEMVRSFRTDRISSRQSENLADVMEKLRSLEEFADDVHGVLRVEKGHQSFKQCLDAIGSIKQGVQEDGGDAPTNAQRLQMFVTSVHKLLCVIEKPGSLQDCLETIRQQIEHGLGTSARELSTHEPSVRIVQHFMELFEIHNINEVSSAINELYVTYAERNAGIARLRSSLRNSIPVRESLDTPGRVLNKAADVIDSIFDKSQHMIGLEAVNKSADQSQEIGDMSLNMFEDDLLLEAVESATHRQDPQFNVLDWGA
ncbi:hypothetical protein HDU78_011833 [Chytriomyces hyalinus]|nr:hypothetical protein HDU78_011833 [Chytriomyces hyalinus]